MLAPSLIPLDRAALADRLGRLGLAAQWRIVTGTTSGVAANVPLPA